MACCILTAIVMHQLIKICDAFDIRFLQIRYNDDEGGPCAPVSAKEHIKSTTCRINIDGMTCGACSFAITQKLEALDGVHRASVSLALTRAVVSYDASALSAVELVRHVHQAGYEAVEEEMDDMRTIERLNQKQELHELRQAISSATVCSTLIASLEYMPAFPRFDDINAYLSGSLVWILLALAFRVQIWDAWPIHKRAWINGMSKLTMDSLLSQSLLLGLGLSITRAIFDPGQSSVAYASSGSFTTVIILAGRYLEAVLKRESHRNLAMLYELQAERETYRLIESEVTVSASLLRKGDQVLVPPQTTIPCDCFIMEGSSAINESTITGESMPAVKTVGDMLVAGSKNLSRPLLVTIAQSQSESSLAKVIESVSEATEQRLEGIKPLDTVMNFFVSGVMCLASAAFIARIWSLQSQDLVFACVAACERAATVLASACPCGIGLAIPSAAMAGIDVAYSKGVLLGGGIATMQALSETTHVVMDKTGTLTQGRLEVFQHYYSPDLKLNRQVCSRLLAAAEFEEARVHPVAKAVFKWALSQSRPTKPDRSIAHTRNLQPTLGMGVSCEVRVHTNEWIPVHVGHASFLSSHNIFIPLSDMDQEPQASIVHFAFSHQYAGYLLLHDTLRFEAKPTVDGLLQFGKEVIMLTGDTATEAVRISSSLGIRVLGSRALPQDKVSHVQKLQKQGHRVAMIGDGINDAPAQAAADVGVSMSLAQKSLVGAGSVVILSNDLSALLDLFQISRKVLRQAKFNVAWALLYNAFALSLAMGMWEPWGWGMGPKGAGMMMAGSSVSVLCMSLWLRWTLGRTY